MSSTHLGHTARKRFGQNFLHDQYIISQIVAIIGPQKDHNLVEIGPGLGAITEPVCELVDHLNVVELDRDLAKRLKSHPFIGAKLNVIEADAMKYDFSQLTSADRPLRVFGNLPYNISTPLMFHLFSFAEKIADMHFMLQKEVVNRLAAEPGNKNYGRLSVMAQYHCQVTSVLDVPPSAFKPAPKVDSAVVRLIPHQQKPYVAEHYDNLNLVCTAAFNQRRKTLRNSLSKLLSEQQISAIGIDPQWRAEKLSLQDYVNLANLLPAG